MDLAHEIRQKTDPEIVYGIFLTQQKKIKLIQDIDNSIAHLKELNSNCGDLMTNLMINNLQEQLKVLRDES